jgi:hypothetical protein
MTWRWDQSAGLLSHNGKLVARGYSGAGKGKNNPEAEGQRAVGPIPRGMWKIRAPYNSKAVGPYVLPVWAVDDVLDDVHKPTGRSAFRIHGDSIRKPGTASKGCIILPRGIREQIWQSGDRDLEVVA